MDIFQHVIKQAKIQIYLFLLIRSIIICLNYTFIIE